MFTYQDALHILGLSEEKSVATEIFNIKTSKSRIITADEAVRLFPELASVDNANVVYAPAIMAHSLPVKNVKGRCFTPKTLHRSAASVRDNLVNIEHELIDNEIGASKDSVCGHIKSVFLSHESDEPIPLTPVELYALAVLYARHTQAKKIAAEYASGTAWNTSMECGHDVLKSHFLLGNEFIPFKEAPPDMLQCVKSDKVLSYKGKELAFVLGGVDGIVNFWGLALTRCPADKDANVLGMFTATPKETASHSLFFPIMADFQRKTENLERFPETASDNLLKETASLIVIGKTSENDGHSHRVLSNGMVMPEGGHSHGIHAYILKPGSKPTFTAVLSEHSIRIGSGDYPDWRHHTHVIEINLKDEFKDSKGIFSETSSIGDDMPKVLDDLRKAIVDLRELGSALKPAGAGSATTGAEDQRIATAIRSIQKIEDMNLEKTIASAVDEKITEKTEAGEIVSKEDSEKAVKEAVDAAVKQERETISLAQEREKRLNARFDAVKALGIELEHSPREGVTIESIVRGIPLDDAGEEIFQNNLAVWSALAKKVGGGTTAQAAEAASTKVSVKPLLTVGAGATKKDGASVGGGAAAAANTPKFGKDAITVV